MSQLRLLLQQFAAELSTEFPGLTPGSYHDDEGCYCFTVLYSLNKAKRSDSVFGRTQYSLWLLGGTALSDLEIALWDDLVTAPGSDKPRFGGRSWPSEVTTVMPSGTDLDLWVYRAVLSDPTCLDGLYAAIIRVGLAESRHGQ